MKWIPGGEFLMGSDRHDPEEAPTHRVSVAGFWMDATTPKGRLNFSPEFFLTSWAMIGGFGVSSDFTWDAMGGLGYNASDSISLVAGYRGLSVDYDNDGFKFDVVMHGPFLGAVFQF